MEGEATASGIIGYYHLGIYIGKDADGNGQVIDFTNNSEVRRVHLNVFAGSGSIYRVCYISAPPTYAPEVIVARAATSWKDPKEFDPSYNVVLNNCEHFVTYCTFGRRFSLQVAKGMKTAASAVSAVFAASAALRK